MPSHADLIERPKVAATREDGQTMAEYAVVLAMITVAVMAAITALSGGVSGAITTVTGIV